MDPISNLQAQRRLWHQSHVEFAVGPKCMSKRMIYCDVFYIGQYSDMAREKEGRGRGARAPGAG